MTINCGALPDTLLESELFGYKAGAFTHAVKDKPGHFAASQGDTLLLDEIGDVSAAFQVRLLRVLEKREVQPLGAVKTSAQGSNYANVIPLKVAKPLPSSLPLLRYRQTCCFITNCNF